MGITCTPHGYHMHTTWILSNITQCAFALAAPMVRMLILVFVWIVLCTKDKSPYADMLLTWAAKSAPAPYEM